MIKRFVVTGAVVAVAYGGFAVAQFPILDMVANRVIERYQGSSCQQLWQNKGKPKTQEEQRVITMLRNDPQMQQAFINKVAAPIVNKMFTCGLIP